MKVFISAYLVIVASIFGQNTDCKNGQRDKIDKSKDNKCEEMFYVTVGSCTPTRYNPHYSRGERSGISVGMGVRTFFDCAFGMDVGATFYHHPRIHAMEGSIVWLCKPKILGGVYGGFGANMQKEMDMFFNRQLSFSWKALAGYQFPNQNGKSSFLDVGFDRFKVLTVRSGLLF